MLAAAKKFDNDFGCEISGGADVQDEFCDITAKRYKNMFTNKRNTKTNNNV